MSDVAEVVADIEETLGFYDGVEEAIPDALRGVLDAARRWVRVVSEFPSDEQVEAAAEALYLATVGGNAEEMEPFGTYASDETYRARAKAALVAAVGVEKETE